VIENVTPATVMTDPAIAWSMARAPSGPAPKTTGSSEPVAPIAFESASIASAAIAASSTDAVGTNHRLCRMCSIASRMRIGQPSVADGLGATDSLGTGVAEGAGSPGSCSMIARLVASSTPMSRNTNSPADQV